MISCDFLSLTRNMYPLLRSESIWPDSEKKSPEFDHIGPKSKKKKDAVRGRNGCMQPLQTQNVGEECSYICYVVALIACVRSTFGNDRILSSFFSFILTSNKDHLRKEFFSFGIRKMSHFSDSSPTFWVWRFFCLAALRRGRLRKLKNHFESKLDARSDGIEDFDRIEDFQWGQF